MKRLNKFRIAMDVFALDKNINLFKQVSGGQSTLSKLRLIEKTGKIMNRIHYIIKRMV